MEKNYIKALLISDIEEEYNELLKYGIKKVDYFRSIVRADKYFKQHPEKLEEYNLVLLGNQVNRHSSFDKYLDINRTLKKLEQEGKTLVVPIYNYDNGKVAGGFLTAFLVDKNNHSSYFPRTYSYKLLFEEIERNFCLNNTIFIEEDIDEEFIPIKDYINPIKLELPKKVSDLKILYLESYLEGNYPDKIKEKLGINLTTYSDGNSSLGEYVKENLGEYDIIIASSRFSSNLLTMNDESTEQCKDTGRKLTLLVTYDEKDESIFDEDSISIKIGNKITLQCVCGGELSKNLTPTHRSYNTLLPKLKESDLRKNTTIFLNLIEIVLKHESNMKNIIEQTIYLYNDILLTLENRGLEDINYKTIKELNKEYSDAVELEQKKKQKALEPIQRFHSFKGEILKYLKYREQGLVLGEPKGFKIEETDTEVTVYSVDNDKINMTLTFEKEYHVYNLRVFSIQIPLKRNTSIEPDVILLTKPQTVGLYTKRFENQPETPSRPLPEEMGFVNYMFDKVEMNIKPINTEIADLKKKVPNLETESRNELPEKTKKLSLFKRIFKR